MTLLKEDGPVQQHGAIGADTRAVQDPCGGEQVSFIVLAARSPVKNSPASTGKEDAERGGVPDPHVVNGNSGCRGTTGCHELGEHMGFEVDFLPVGEGERSGDAIAIRCGDLTGSRNRQFVMVIDGGTVEAGERLVEHVEAYYGTDTVDLVVNTHPDGDHSSGLCVVVQKLKVGHLWMHQPWKHSGEICDLFRDGILTKGRLSAEMQKALGDAWDLEKLANRKGIRITEPFSDGEANRQYNGITILGPSVSYYENLLPDFRDMPDVKEQVAAFFSEGFRAVGKAAAALVERVAEGWGIETLKDPEEKATSAENNSSVVLLLQLDGKQLLFTGDAGVPALERAADLAERLGIDLTASTFEQGPHHGSKRNVGPTILNRIVGPKLPSSTSPKTKIVFVSASKGGMPKHPAKKVTNAYQRRGATVLATQGETLRHSQDAPARSGWVSATPLPFYNEVED
jgi:beta-lactamase superfamily II metal-dependent hydrolase